MATASSLGEYYQYVIDRPVELARQKSALLPIVNKDVEGKRVSIYNQDVQAKHPLLGLRFNSRPVKVVVDPASASLLEGATLDFKDGLQGAGFSINNPNASRTCGCGQSFS